MDLPNNDNIIHINITFLLQEGKPKFQQLFPNKLRD